MDNLYKEIESNTKYYAYLVQNIAETLYEKPKQKILFYYKDVGFKVLCLQPECLFDSKEELYSHLKEKNIYGSIQIGEAFKL